MGCKIKLFSETSFYWAFWILSVAYGLHCVGEIRTDVDFPEEFFETTWLGKRDRTDFEWESWYQNALKASPFCIINFLVSTCIPTWHALQWWRIIWSCVFLVVVLSPIALIVILQTLVFHVITLTTNRKVVPWTACLAFLYLLNNVSFDSFIGDSGAYLMGLIQSWVLLRNISYCVDVQDKKEAPSFVQCLAYSLYMPLIFSGPVILYADYSLGAKQKRPVGLDEENIGLLLKGLARYLFWGAVLFVWLHFIYANAISFVPWNVYTLPISTVYGLVYCLGQAFMLKYSVIYGLSGTLARAEGIKMPEPPKCIARIHLYSDMWRVFDPGLYRFLNRYINTPAREYVGSWFIASLTSFAFVFVWHGTSLYIFVWSILNWVGIVLERLVITYTRNEGNVATLWTSHRLKAAIATPLLFLAALSNGYFLAGYEVGNIFVLRSIESSMTSKIILLAILYSCCQVSQQVKEHEIQKKQVLKASRT